MLSKLIIYFLVSLAAVTVNSQGSATPDDAAFHACQKNTDCQNPDYCAGVPNCLAGSNCTDGFCECATGHFGWLCEFASCDDYTKCQNDGDCLIIENKHVCSCGDDYTGTYCETYMCNELTNCNGKCANLHQCTCDPQLLAQKGSACTPECSIFNPCKNGGTCDVNDGRYECSCPEGFAGTRCEKPKCDDSWCPGICYEEECLCPPGWKGPKCEKTDCSEFKACEGVGYCDDSDNDLKCVCDETTYGGKYCEYNCTKKCQYGTCGADETCYCKVGFTGETCNITLHTYEMSKTLSYVNYSVIALIVIILVLLYVMKNRVGIKDAGQFIFDKSLSRSAESIDFVTMPGMHKLDDTRK